MQQHVETQQTLQTHSLHSHVPVFQGDIDRGDADIGSPFDFNLSTKDPTYRTQYRNYKGETPQLTFIYTGKFLYR